MSTAHTEPVVAVSNLAFSYRESTATSVWAINNLSLTISSGEIVCILGASGCGKSTLLNLIAGLIRPASGSIEFPSTAGGQHRIGYIFQQDALFPWSTVEANLCLAHRIDRKESKLDAHKRIKQYLKAFHLSESVLRKFPSQLSGGMRQRVSIIQSLMFDPTLLLLDEPFSALDFFTKLSLESEFFGLIKEGKKAAILVTHDIEEAIAMGSRVLLMSKDGRIMQEIVIELDGDDRLPENARGSAKFSEYYRQIWSELKALVM